MAKREDERAEMTPDAILLRQIIGFNEPAAPVAIPVMLGLYWAYPATVVLVLTIAVAPTLVIQRFAVHYADTNRVREGINALALAIWIPTLAMAILAPALWALVCVFCFLSVVLAVPFVDSAHLLRLTLVASAILVVGGISTMIDPILSFDVIPERFLSGIAAVGAVAGAILCMLSVRQSNGRLLDTLDATQQANEALRQSEQSLERKVTARTAELGEARDAALQASRAKSDFLANMSHELRTPLNAIIGYGEMLQEEVIEDENEDYRPDLDRIVGAGRQLLGLINDVLDLSKIEAGKMEVHLEEFDIAEFLDDIEGTITPLTQKRSNRLVVDYPADIGAMRSDITKVRQGLFNILSNAAKFTDAGTITLAARRDVRAEGVEEMVFRISDTGIGMTPEQIESVFESFSQAEETTARDYGGTGLGLAITKEFCEMLGGSIECTSEPGTGSQFEIRLPDVNGDASIRPPVFVDGPTGSEASTVLIVDDDDAARDLLTRFFTGEGFNVVSASNGASALQLARSTPPDVITLDVIMPDMDGWDVLRSLKADPTLGDIPVILMTITDEEKLGYALGAAEYLTKPIDWDRLGAALARMHVDHHGTVLVVDDDPSARDLVIRGMRRNGWDVAEAANGRLALEHIEAHPPALILLDLMMPEMDGFEFVAALHQREEWRSIPIIVITSMDLTTADRSRLGGRVEQVFTKTDYTMEDLLDEVRRVVLRTAERSG